MVSSIGSSQFPKFFFPEENHNEDPYEVDIVIKESLVDVNIEVPRTDKNCSMRCSYPCGTRGCHTAGCGPTETGSNCLC